MSSLFINVEDVAFWEMSIYQLQEIFVYCSRAFVICSGLKHIYRAVGQIIKRSIVDSCFPDNLRLESGKLIHLFSLIF